MLNTNQVGLSYIYRIADVVIVCLCLLAALQFYQVGFSSRLLSAMLLSVMGYLLFAEMFSLYRSWRAFSSIKLLVSTAAAWVFACCLLFVLAFMLKVGEDFSRLAIGTWMLSTLITLCLWRMILRQVLKSLRRAGFNSRSAAIVGLNELALDMRHELKTHPDTGIKFKGFYDDREPERLAQNHSIAELKGNIDTLIEQTQKGVYDLIFIALPLRAQERINDILTLCGDTTVSVHLIPDFFVYNLLHARSGAVGRIETLSVYETPIVGFNDFAKRLFDIVFSVFALLLVSPLLFIIALAIKLTSKGPVIFKQDRYGLDGKTIKVWKFRSMTTQDNADKVIQASKNDARITAVGAFIRKTSLDELPQFFNVLQGSMSVVGPRPHARAHNEEYRKLIAGYMLRHKVKPGITGLAQINGYRGETDTLDKMEGRIRYDLDYIRRWSFWLDIKIVLLTVFKGFVNKNAY